MDRPGVPGLKDEISFDLCAFEKDELNRKDNHQDLMTAETGHDEVRALRGRRPRSGCPTGDCAKPISDAAAQLERGRQPGVSI